MLLQDESSYNSKHRVLYFVSVVGSFRMIRSRTVLQRRQCSRQGVESTDILTFIQSLIFFHGHNSIFISMSACFIHKE